MNKSMILNTIISATIGGVIGGIVTYLTVKKSFEEMANSEIAEVKRHYALIRKESGVVSIFGENTEADERIGSALISKAEDLIKKHAYTNVRDLQESENAEETQSIFDLAVEVDEDGKVIEPEEVDDYEREEGEPYLISVEEFFNSAEEYDKMSLSYYEGDDTLVDDRDSVIDDVDYVVGERHLQMFGKRSDDPNIVYIRNENLSSDFEVTLEPGEYAIRVLGLDEEVVGLREPKKRPKKMRDDD